MLEAKIRERLNAPIPADVVKEREIGGRKTASYLEGWYVEDLLNQIVGPGSWGSEIVSMTEQCRDLRDDGEKGKRWHVTYSAHVRVKIEGALSHDGRGTGHGIDRDLGAAIESAEKEAETDAEKRALKKYGRALGLALYDKEQRHVDHGQPRHPEKLSECRTADELQAWLGTNARALMASDKRSDFLVALEKAGKRCGVSDGQAIQWATNGGGA